MGSRRCGQHSAMTRVPLCFVLMSLLPALAAAFNGGSKQTAPSMGFMDRRAAENELLLALGEALGNGHGADLQSLEGLARRLEPTFAALPQNRHGRIEGPALGHLIQSYFTQKRGWQIKGLEPHRNSSTSKLSDMLPVLKQKVPSYIQSLFEGQQTPGFVLKDAVVLVALLEHLILDEHIEFLKWAYQVNDLSTDETVSEDVLDSVLESHVILWVFGVNRNHSNKSMHHSDKEILKEMSVWDKRRDLTWDVHRNSVFLQVHQRNPFVSQRFSFEDVAEMLPAVEQGYFELQQRGCSGLKDGLMDLDPAATGRVPLGKFYAARRLGNANLRESPDYLRSLGAFDDTESGRGAQVIISNYIGAISNCEANLQYYALCCVNQCESILNSLEVHFQAPAAQPSEILALVAKQRLSIMDEPRNLSAAILGALDQIASLHDGVVPLHSRMFAQWMHYAFPHECPYPWLPGVINPLSEHEYEQKMGWGKERATEEAKEKQMAAVVGELVNPMSMWTFEEEMRLGSLNGGGSLHNVATLCVSMTQVAAGFAVLFGFWRSVYGTTRRWLDNSKAKTEHFV